MTFLQFKQSARAESIASGKSLLEHLKTLYPSNDFDSPELSLPLGSIASEIVELLRDSTMGRVENGGTAWVWCNEVHQGVFAPRLFPMAKVGLKALGLVR